MCRKNIKNLIFLAIFIFLLIELIFTKNIFAEEEKIWIDTSHWEIQTNFVSDGYWKANENKRWVDTSYKVNQGYWSYDSYQVWVDTSHWVNSGYWITENHNIWVNSGYYKTNTYNVWVKSGYTIYKWVNSGYWSTYSYKVWVSSGYMAKVEYGYWEIVKEYGWSINRLYPVIGSAGHAQWRTKNYYYWVDTSHYETRYATRWIDTSHWESQYIDTSHWEQKQSTVWVDTSHWETKQRLVWKDTSYYVIEGHWETRTGKHWIDTSYIVNQGYWEYYITYTWIDTSHWETNKVWITSGYFANPMHGKIIVEKYPKYVFTKWHKDLSGNEASMNLKITWKIDNSDINLESEKRKINKIYIYEDVVRYNDKGVEKVIIFDGNVLSAEEGSVNADCKFEHAGSEESILHVYVYAERGEAGHISFANPINGFRSINISQDNSNSNPDSWLGGITYEVFEF